MELDSLPLPTCVHLSLTPCPLRVDIINGWPLREREGRVRLRWTRVDRWEGGPAPCGLPHIEL